MAMKGWTRLPDGINCRGLKVDSLGRSNERKRGFPKRPIWKRGHANTPENRYPDRHCRICKRQLDAERWLKSYPAPTDTNPPEYWNQLLRTLLG